MESVSTTRLRLLRRKLGMSQKQFAEDIGVNVMTVSNWENGKQFPRHQHLTRLVEMYGTEIINFFKEEL
jgi:transcriptional regulator with XRE-family HTH domain